MYHHQRNSHPHCLFNSFSYHSIIQFDFWHTGSTEWKEQMPGGRSYAILICNNTIVFGCEIFPVGKLGHQSRNSVLWLMVLDSEHGLSNKQGMYRRLFATRLFSWFEDWPGRLPISPRNIWSRKPVGVEKYLDCVLLRPTWSHLLPPSPRTVEVPLRSRENDCLLCYYGCLRETS